MDLIIGLGMGAAGIALLFVAAVIWPRHRGVRRR